MRRIQFCIDDELWRVLQARAMAGQVSVSELVRTAVRERYLGQFDRRAAAMRAVVGIRKTDGAPGAVDAVRALRRGNRIEKLHRA